MRWKEQSEPEAMVSDHIIELSFRIGCDELPVDHAEALSVAVLEKLPWLDKHPGCGVHPIHVAASGNGWNRPENHSGEMLQLSKRTRLYIRVPKTEQNNALMLSNQTLDVSGNAIEVGMGQIRYLLPSTTLFSRSVCCEFTTDESEFNDWAVSEIEGLGIPVSKMLCGLQHKLKLNREEILARSCLLADLTSEQSIKLQQTGLGANRIIGCGMFIPHKSLGAVGASQDDD